MTETSAILLAYTDERPRAELILRVSLIGKLKSIKIISMILFLSGQYLMVCAEKNVFFRGTLKQNKIYS
jgi:hypothetical protein